MALSQLSETAPIVANVGIDNSNGTSDINLVGPPYGAWRVDSLLMQTDDTASRVVDVKIAHQGFVSIIGSATLPAGAGLGGSPSVDLLQALPTSAQSNIVLGAGDELIIAMETAITSGKSSTITVLGGTL